MVAMGNGLISERMASARVEARARTKGGKS
jgi:hypothetical protein